MALTRISKFGFPPKDALPSVNTVRLVPLSTGMKTDSAWPLQAPGSAASMSNFLPLDGVLIPRSRLSSLNTIASIGSITLGMTPQWGVNSGGILWLSGRTRHGEMNSIGSISQASFVSSFGLGVAKLLAPDTIYRWDYATTYYSPKDENIIIAAQAPSADTLFCLYHTAASGNGVPLYSYLTSAPKALAVAAYDSYVMAFNITAPTFTAATRVQWCVRGNPSNWTGEGSGFEDLTDMKGDGLRIVGTDDNRVLLFSSREIWYGVSATYPAQFQFFPFDRTVGCLAARTLIQTDAGILFLGSDRAVHLIPRGGGITQIISATMRDALASIGLQLQDQSHFATYDPIRKLYYLFIDFGFYTSVYFGFVLNIVTGEWGRIEYHPVASSVPNCGTAYYAGPASGVVGTLYYGNSGATIYSENSSLGMDYGDSLVTCTWRSPVIAADLPGTYKQLQNVNIDYRATSKSTVTLKISQDGGNNYEATGKAVSLTSAPYSGRASVDVYSGGAFPTIELTSTSTGFELHRIDVTLGLGGQR